LHTASTARFVATASGSSERFDSGARCSARPNAKFTRMLATMSGRSDGFHQP
jgi:hypothetical protein